MLYCNIVDTYVIGTVYNMYHLPMKKRHRVHPTSDCNEGQYQNETVR